MKRRNRIIAVLALAFAAGVLGALVFSKLNPPTDLKQLEVERAVERLAQLPKRLAEGAPSLGSTRDCPTIEQPAVVPTVELDDLQRTSNDWHFLADENTSALRAERDWPSAQAINAAKHLVIFAAEPDGKQLPSKDTDGHFHGTMVLVSLVDSAAVCSTPLSVSAPASSFRDVLREAALINAQQLGVRIGLPLCRGGS